MTDYEEERRSELEVLESIFPDELTILSPDSLSVLITPDLPSSSSTPSHVLSLLITYSEKYPDELPEIGIRVEEGELSEDEEEQLVMGLIGAANDSLGMAMVYTLSQYLGESLAALLEERKLTAQRMEAEISRKEDEAQAARIAGTKVTPESFDKWKIKFEKEMQEKLKREEQDRLKALPPKEREEVKRNMAKYTGRQLFEKDASLASQDALDDDEDATSVDVSKYERREGLSDSEDEDDDGVAGLQLSDSD